MLAGGSVPTVQPQPCPCPSISFCLEGSAKRPGYVPNCGCFWKSYFRGVDQSVQN